MVKKKKTIITVIKCKRCKQFIWSRSHHDFRTCKCGNCSVDGGREYVRIVGKRKNFELHYLEIPQNFNKTSFIDFGKMCMKINTKNGWPVAEWGSKTDIPLKLALLHSEVSEALESFRHNDYYEYIEELADVFVRSFDQAASIDHEDLNNAFNMLAFELYVKIQINMLRGYHHGNKRA